MGKWYEGWNDKSSKTFKEAFNKDNFAGSAVSILGGIGSMAGTIKSNATVDADRYYDELERFGNIQFNSDNFNSLIQDYQNASYNMPEFSDIAKSSGEKLHNTLGAITSGATTGATIGGPWGAVIGGALGLGSGLIGWAIGDNNAKKELDNLNIEYNRQKANNAARFNYSAELINDKTFNGAAMNYMALGGDLYDNAMINKHYNNGKVKYNKQKYIGNLFAYGGQIKLAGDWSNGVNIIGEGGTHELNPYDGVQIGVDNNGTPNLVEEGEVIFNDYVYSNRLKPTEEQLDEVKLCPSFNGKTFADIAKIISTESTERPNDPISKNGLIDGMMKLQVIQEDTRMAEQEKEFKKNFNKLVKDNPEILSAMMDGNPQQQNQEGVQPFDFNARYAPNGNPADMLNDQYPEEFADGGNLFAEAGYLDFDNTKGFKYFNNGKYDQGYLDWLNKYDIANSSYWNDLSSLYKNRIGRDLTINEARRLGQDQKFGQFHKLLGDAYTEHLRQQNPLPGVTPPKMPGAISNNSIITKDGIVQSKAPDSLVNAKPKTEYTKTYNPNDYEYDNSDWLRYMPAIGSGITAIADLFGLNRPDYRNAKIIGDYANRIRSARAPMLYNYMRFTPYDVNYEQNRKENLGLATQRNILNTSSGNRAAALASLLAGYNSTVAGMGDLYRNAIDYNDKQRQIVSDFNRGTDQYNASNIMNTSQMNINADVQRANLMAQMAKMMDDIDTQSSAARSANISNFFNNMGKVGLDNYYNNQAEWALKNGVYPYNEQTKRYPGVHKKGGKIRKCKRLI